MKTDLRLQVKLLKATHDITYKEIAEMINIKPRHFYNWIRGTTNFTESKTEELRKLVAELNKQ